MSNINLRFNLGQVSIQVCGKVNRQAFSRFSPETRDLILRNLGIPSKSQPIKSPMAKFNLLDRPE